MRDSTEVLKELSETLEKYRKNKTLVAPEDLNGKYKKSFEKLKNELRELVSEYLRVCCFSGMKVKQSDSGEIILKIETAYKKRGIAKEVGRAVFQEFSLKELQRVAGKFRQSVLDEIWFPYFQRFTCLYVCAACIDESNSQTPMIYNDLVDKFYNEDTKEWIKREKPPGDAILIFLK